MTSRTPFLGLALALALPAGPAAARDLCLALEPAGYSIVFRSVKKAKPLRVLALHGIAVTSPANVVPVHGTAYVNEVGAVELGITGYGIADEISNVMIHAELDDTFAGTAVLDTDGDFAADALAATLAPVDCRTVQIPVGIK